MARKTTSSNKAHAAGEKKKNGEPDMAAGLRSLSKLYTAPEGTSPFAIAAANATENDLRRVKEVIGPIDLNMLVRLYEKTGNLLWLWVTVAVAKTPADIPPKTFEYLHGVGKQFFAGIVEQACSLEKLQVIPGKEEIEEAIVRRSETRPVSPDILTILGLSHPGRNLFQAAAGNIRDGSMAVAVEDRASKGDRTRENIYADLATVFGRTSPEAGVSTASIKQFATRGSKILPSRPAKKRT